MKRCKDLSVMVIAVLCLVSFLGFNTLAPAIAGAADEPKPAAAAKEKKATKKSVVKKKGPAPVFAPTEKVVKLEGKNPSVLLTGTGFEPEKEVRILFTDAEGMQTDVGYALAPEPKVDKMGNFFTTWSVGEFVKAKLVQEGIFTLTVTDAQFKPITETHVVFLAVKAEKGDKKDKKDKGDKEKGEKKDKGEKEKKS